MGRRYFIEPIVWLLDDSFHGGMWGYGLRTRIYRLRNIMEDLQAGYNLRKGGSTYGVILITAAQSVSLDALSSMYFDRNLLRQSVNFITFKTTLLFHLFKIRGYENGK